MVTKKRTFLSLLLLVGGISSNYAYAADNGAADEVRDTYAHWVELRKTIAEEKSGWEEDKAIIGDQIKVLEAEKGSLEALIKEAEDTTDKTKDERTALLEKKDAAIDAVSVLEEKVPAYEKQLLDLVSYFPGPLLEEVKPLLNRVPAPGEETRQNVGQRIQNVVGILTQMDKFNQGVTVVSEVKDIGSGRSVEVKTIYLGLGIAYFVDRNGEYAGYGVPAAGGWQWTVEKDMAVQVQTLVTTYENVSKASFVTVPVKID